MQHTLEQQIRQRAYEIWATSGRRDGQAEQHWLAAEREVLAAFAPANRPRRPRKAAAAGTRRRAASA